MTRSANVKKGKAEGKRSKADAENDSRTKWTEVEEKELVKRMCHIWAVRVNTVVIVTAIIITVAAVLLVTIIIIIVITTSSTALLLPLS